MGEIADMMLDGTLCQHCGTYIGDGDGIPDSCGCLEDEFEALNRERKNRHQEWHIANMDIIKKSGLVFREASRETLCFRETGKPKVDFFPSTGRWRDLNKNKTLGGGAEKFINWYKNYERTR